ncbi:MAG: chitobiase/beta-hexosaminidase C-terminal domain-containing protein, partial [Candidatus Ornithomonoglobus sp.]
MIIKSIICFMAALSAIFGINASAEDNDKFLVYAINSHLVDANNEIMDILPNPYVYQSVSFVPVRYSLLILGATLDYNADDNSITVYYKGEAKKKSLDGCIYEYDVSYLPARDIAELVGGSVGWNDGILAISTGQNAQEYSDRTDYYKERLNYTGSYDLYEEIEYKNLPKTITFSADAGCYENEFMLEISTNVRNAVIHYTTDGSDPTRESPVYTEPIRIYNRTYEENVAANVTCVVAEDFRYPTGLVQKGMTVKAMAYNEEGDGTAIYVSSYFVGVDFAQRYKMKVISLSANYDWLFNEQTGLFSYNNSIQLSNWYESQAFIEIFDESNNRVIAQPAGLRLNGAGSRVFQQKSIRVYARENTIYQNGDKKSIKCDLFNGKVTDNNFEQVTKFKRFILRNGGDDWKEFFMKDALVHSLCKPLDVDIQASENCIVYLNGEFFGFYRLRERYDDEYFQYHYNLNDEKDAVIVQIANNPNV